MATDPRIGTRLGPYLIQEQIGTGGMGRVYKAVHDGLGTVALKLLHPSFTDNDEFRERFLSEARHARTISRSVPSIVHVYDAGELDGVLYLAMDYMEGGDLRALIDRSSGGMDPAQAAQLLARVAEALDAAHAEGLVHRDVKPQNVLLDERGRPFLSDFGVAKELALKRTQTGAFLGTVSYASPEQIQGQELDRRADVYSLGCVLYECLTGNPAYEKDSEIALMYAHLLEPPPSITEARPDLPSPIDAVLAKAMAKSRDDRYSTTVELAGALNDALAGTRAAAPARPAPVETVLSASPPTAPPPAAVPPPPPETAPTLPVPAGRSRPAWLVPLLIVIPLVLLGGGGAAAFLLTRHHKAAKAGGQVVTFKQGSTQGTSTAVVSGSAAFSDPPNLFSEKTTPKGRTYFSGSSMYLTNTARNSPLLTLASGNYDNVRVSVDVQEGAGSNDYGVSVVCRHQTDTDYYLIAIASGQRYNIVRYTGGQPRSLIGGFQTSAAINPTSEKNHVVATCNGIVSTVLTLDVNGQRVAQVTDSPGIGDGAVGLRAGTLTPPIRVRFDNFRLQRLS